MNHLSQFISQYEVTDSTVAMPLLHTTSGYGFREIIENGMRLEPKKDLVFEEDLLYFFYGKPLYTQTKEMPASLGSELPVFFLLTLSKIASIKRLFPFDSGAFVTGKYGGHIPSMHLDDFLIELDNGLSAKTNTPLRVVSAFFETNTNYFNNTPRSNLPLDSLHLEVEVYVNMIRSREQALFDERASTIEVQSDTSFELTKDSLEAVILPSTFLDSRIVVEAMGGLEAEIFTYPPFRMQPSYVSALALAEVGSFLSAKSII